MLIDYISVFTVTVRFYAIGNGFPPDSFSALGRAIGLPAVQWESLTAYCAGFRFHCVVSKYLRKPWVSWHQRTSEPFAQCAARICLVKHGAVGI